MEKAIEAVSELVAIKNASLKAMTVIIQNRNTLTKDEIINILQDIVMKIKILDEPSKPMSN